MNEDEAKIYDYLKADIISEVDKNNLENMLLHIYFFKTLATEINNYYKKDIQKQELLEKMQVLKDYYLLELKDPLSENFLIKLNEIYEIKIPELIKEKIIP